MGRYPLLEVAKEYIQRRSGFIAKSTKTEMERKYRYLNRVFARLKKEGKIMHTNPMKLDRGDIGVFVEWTKERNLCGSSTEKLLRHLRQLCAFVGNPVFERMKAEGEEFPRRSPNGINALAEDEVRAIMQAAKSIDGWQGEVVRFITAMYPFTGARPSELRLAHIEDIDTRR